MVTPGIYVSSHRERLVQVAEQKEEPFRLFTGYSGWGPGQLDAELERGGWLTCPAISEHVFSIDPDELWDHVSKNIGKEITMKSLGIRHVPDDPSVN